MTTVRRRSSSFDITYISASDTSDIRAARRLLERLGCLVDTVADGEEAVAAIARAQ